MITVRPLVDGDVEAYFGRRIGMRLAGYAGVDEQGQVVGVGGVAFWPGGAITGFLDARDEVRRHKILLHKTALRVMADWRRRGGTHLRIFCDPAIPRSRDWARRLGFEPVSDDEDGSWVWRAT